MQLWGVAPLRCGSGTNDGSASRPPVQCGDWIHEGGTALMHVVTDKLKRAGHSVCIEESLLNAHRTLEEYTALRRHTSQSTKSERESERESGSEREGTGAHPPADMHAGGQSAAAAGEELEQKELEQKMFPVYGVQVLGAFRDGSGRYSGYLLYWEKSTNTDAAGSAAGERG